MYFLLLGLTGQDTAFSRLGLKVLSKVIEREKILPDGARGREHLICKQRQKGRLVKPLSLQDQTIRTEVMVRLSKCRTQTGQAQRAAEAAGQQGLICASVTAERCPTLTAGELLVASFSGSCSFPVIQIGPVRTLSLRL